MPVSVFSYPDISSTFLQIPLINTEDTSLVSGVSSPTYTTSPPPCTLVCPPPPYSPFQPYLHTEFFHALFFFPIGHFLLHPTPVTIASDHSDTPLQFSIAFPPNYESRINPAPQSPSAVTSLGILDSIVCHNSHRYRSFDCSESTRLSHSSHWVPR